MFKGWNNKEKYFCDVRWKWWDSLFSNDLKKYILLKKFLEVNTSQHSIVPSDGGNVSVSLLSLLVLIFHIFFLVIFFLIKIMREWQEWNDKLSIFTQKDTCSTLLFKYWTVLIGYSSSNWCYFLLKVQNLYQVLFCFIYTNACDTIPLVWGSAGWREGITWPELVSGGA